MFSAGGLDGTASALDGWMCMKGSVEKHNGTLADAWYAAGLMTKTAHTHTHTHTQTHAARLDDECTEVPTLVLDAIIDSFFLIDILVTFNTGIIVSGEYIDSRLQVQI